LRRIRTRLFVRPRIARILGSDVCCGVERGGGQSELQGIYHDREGKTYRTTHIHLCTKEGASSLNCSPVQNVVSPNDVCVTPAQNGWHYLGQQRWSLVDIKSIWTSLGTLVLLQPLHAPGADVITFPPGSTRTCYTLLPERRSFRDNPQAEKGTD